MKWILLLLFLSRLAWAQDRDHASTQTTWQATAQEDWRLFNREKLLDAVADSVRVGTDQIAVRKDMGEPQAVYSQDKKTIWTYGLSERVFFHLVFDAEGRVIQQQKTRYPGFVDGDLSSATNIATLASEPIFDVGSWNVAIGKGDPNHDRVLMAVGAARALRLAMPDKAVESMFGKPNDVLVRADQTFWTYRIRASTFLQFLFLDNHELIGAYIRHYDDLNGRLNLIPVIGVMEKPQEQALDLACWRTTIPGEPNSFYRDGIAKRMLFVVKPGMTREAVVSLLGTPNERFANFVHPTGLHYEATHSSLLLIVLDSQGRVVKSENFEFPHSRP